MKLRILGAVLLMNAVCFAEIVSDGDLAYLTELTRAVAAASRVEPHQKAGKWENRLGFTFLKPGGLDCYPAFWIRDFVMSLECGVVPREMAEAAFDCIARHQAKADVALASGAKIPAGSIPDHIRPDDVAVFFPGTYEPAKAGGAVWGFRPAMDDNFFFILLAGYLTDVDMTQYGDALENAFSAVSSDAAGVVTCRDDDRGVSFGFADSIYQTGNLLWATLLKARAAKTLSELFERAGNHEKAQFYAAISARLRSKIAVVFHDESGLLLSATTSCRQPDVWASAYAVYYDLVPSETSDAISEALTHFYLAGEIACEGQIRHVPLSRFASATQCWQKTSCRFDVNVYQNGAYWATPTGWVTYAIARKHPETAKQLFAEYLDHLKQHDFREGGSNGAPWECIYPPAGYCQNAVYLTSVSCPLAAAQRMKKEEK